MYLLEEDHLLCSSYHTSIFVTSLIEHVCDIAIDTLSGCIQDRLKQYFIISLDSDKEFLYMLSSIIPLRLYPTWNFLSYELTFQIVVSFSTSYNSGLSCPMVASTSILRCTQKPSIWYARVSWCLTDSERYRCDSSVIYTDCKTFGGQWWVMPTKCESHLVNFKVLQEVRG